MLRYDDVAKRTGLPVGTLYWLVSIGRIPHYRLGPRTVRFREDEIEAWLQARRVDESAPTGS